MFKVLIVDDEMAMRKGLISKIDWSTLRLTCVGEAEDGLEALEKLEALQPDIVLVDIRMPALDGMALIEKATGQYLHIKWVIVSGYGDFDYARQAMKFGVTDYLLKPVNDCELNECLGKLTVLLSDELEAYTNRQLLEQKFDLYQGTRREYVLNRLVSGKSESQDLKELEQYYPHVLSAAPYWVVAVVCIEPFSLPNISFRSGDEPLIWFSLRNILEEQIRMACQQGIVFRHTHDVDHLVVLISVDKEKFQILCKRLTAGLIAIRKYLRLEGAAGISEPMEQLTNAHTAYRQAVFALKTKLLNGVGQIYDYTEIRLHEKKAGILSLQGGEERLLFSYLSEGKREEIMAWLEERFSQLTQTAHATYYHLERLYIEFDTLFRKYLEQHTSEPEVILDEKSDLLSSLMNMHHWRDVLTEVQRKATFIMSFAGNQGPMSGYTIVSEVKQYMNRNYHENITLKWVAEHYYIHPNYFSKLFKAQCGENFNDYLTRIRFHHAFELMKDPSLKIGRIAEMVGYKDATYFSSLFKKVYQVTPQQYRGQSRAE